MGLDRSVQQLHQTLLLLELLPERLRRDQGLDGIVDQLQALYPVGLGMDRGDVHLVLRAEVNGVREHLPQLTHQHGLVLGGLGAAAAAPAIEGQGLLQGGEHIGVVNDQAAVLAGEDAVGPGDRLHQGVVAHRLVEIQRRAARRIEAGEPHGADEHQPQRIGGVLEALIQRWLGRREPAAVRFDVEAQGGHVGDLVLGGRHDHRHIGAGEDVQPLPQFISCFA